MNRTVMIGLIAIIIISIIIIVITKVDDPSSCKKGTDRRNGNCKTCVAPCPDGDWTNDGVCGCDCIDVEYDPSDLDKATTVIWENGKVVETANNINNAECLYQKYCTLREQLNGFVYDPIRKSCDACSNGKDVCKPENDSEPFCCHDSESACNNGTCCAPTGIYNDTISGTEKCCDSGNISVNNGKAWAPGDDYCTGTSDDCCLMFCGINGHDKPGDGGGDWCESGWDCNISSCPDKDKADNDIEFLNDNPSKYNVVDLPTEENEYNYAYCAKKPQTRSNTISCGGFGSGGLLNGTGPSMFPTMDNIYYNLNFNEGKITMPTTWETKIVKGSDYSSYLQPAAEHNNVRPVPLPTGTILVSLYSIFDHLHQVGETYANFIENYIKSTGGTIHGFYAQNQTYSNATWTNIISTNAATIEEAEKLIPLSTTTTETCKATGDWTGQVSMDSWCVTNCAAGYCPSTHCVCGSTTGTMTVGSYTTLFYDTLTDDPTYDNCIMFVNYIKPFGEIIDDADISNLFEKCKVIVPTSNNAIVTVGDSSFFDNNTDAKCMTDGQIAVIDTSPTVYVSTSNISPNQNTPAEYGNDIKFGTQLIGDVNSESSPSGLLKNSGGPMCIEYNTNSVDSITRKDSASTIVKYTSRQACYDANKCFGGYLRNTKDGACNINGCTENGTEPANMSVTWEEAPLESKYWLQGKNGCYRAATADDKVWGGCHTTGWFSSCSSSISTSPTAKDLKWRGDCKNVSTANCSSRLIDDLQPSFVGYSNAPDYYWCHSRAKKCENKCVIVTGQPPNCFDVCDDGALYYDTGKPPDEVITAREDTRRKNDLCKPQYIPIS
uniref:Uncharacterized protein n=1 Tax=viral metagenome TaxID=1070528 RepID=A0A6C0LTB4_9ZZZZ